MQLDFHYYATYCAACLAGYSPAESRVICYSAQLVDCCTHTFLSTLNAPLSAATTQLHLEMMDQRKDIIGLQDITRIWASFHFLPFDLYTQKEGCSRRYLNKYRLICDVNGDLMVDMIHTAKGRSLQAVGIAMHVLADTWAHRYFAGVPSMVINNVGHWCYEIREEEGTLSEKKIVFRHSPSSEDDIENGDYICTPFQGQENSVMYLGHGRAGHLPDYSWIKYKYLPAWGNYKEIIKDNPSDYMSAFCQMICAMKYLRGTRETFEKGDLDRDAVIPWKDEITAILKKRRTDSSEDWRDFGERLSGEKIEEFDLEKYKAEYLQAPEEEKEGTYLGTFFVEAMQHKSMVTNRIFKSGNMLAGFSIEFEKKGFKGIRDYMVLVKQQRRKNNP